MDRDQEDRLIEAVSRVAGAINWACLWLFLIVMQGC